MAKAASTYHVAEILAVILEQLLNVSLLPESSKRKEERERVSEV